jgi:predicted RNase H-like nuclease (RuvC/YqgF family)
MLALAPSENLHGRTTPESREARVSANLSDHATLMRLGYVLTNQIQSMKDENWSLKNEIIELKEKVQDLEQNLNNHVSIFGPAMVGQDV